MMKSEGSKITIKRKADNNSEALFAKKYERIASAILDLLKGEIETNLIDLIDHVNHELAGKGENNWYVLQVKADLETQGLIRTTFRKRLVPLIKINQRIYKKSKFYKDRRILHNNLGSGW